MCNAFSHLAKNKAKPNQNKTNISVSNPQDSKNSKWRKDDKIQNPEQHLLWKGERAWLNTDMPGTPGEMAADLI